MNDTAVQTGARAEVLAVIDSLYTAWVANDADAVAATYAEDATSILTGSVSEGREAVRTRFKAGFEGPLRNTSVRDEPLSVRFPTPDTAIVVSRGSVLTTDGEPLPPVVATWVIVRNDGRWLITSYHNCPA